MLIRFRLIINILILVICATALGIILYVMLNFKSILNKSLNTGLAVVKQNDSKIQSILNDFSTSSVNHLLADKSVKTSVVNLLVGEPVSTALATVIKSEPVNTALTTVIKSEPVNTALTTVIKSEPVETALASVVKSPQVTAAITESIQKAISNAVIPIPTYS